jgi:hypothetical protein
MQLIHRQFATYGELERDAAERGLATGAKAKI